MTDSDHCDDLFIHLPFFFLSKDIPSSAVLLIFLKLSCGMMIKFNLVGTLKCTQLKMHVFELCEEN